MIRAGLSARDRAITRDRRRRRLTHALYVLACLMPAGTFAAFIIQLWTAP